MSQSTLSKFYQTRKRAAENDLKSTLNKAVVLSNNKNGSEQLVRFIKGGILSPRKHTEGSTHKSDAPSDAVDQKSVKKTLFSNDVEAHEGLVQKKPCLKILADVPCKQENKKEYSQEFRDKLNQIHSRLKKYDPKPVEEPKCINIEITAREQLKKIGLTPSPKKSVSQSGNELSLPFKYRVLVDFFRAMETISSSFSHRQDVITFEKLMHAVQKLTRKKFSEKHLAQIIKVFPESYQVSIKNNALIISPTFDQQQKATLDGLSNRLKVFSDRLTEEVRKSHQEFLEKLNMKLTGTTKTVVRWHPDFNLNDCPDIEPCTLPSIEAKHNFSNAEEILKKVKAMTSKMESPEKIPAPVAKPETTSELLKGIPTSILARIKQKQIEKKSNLMLKKDLLSDEEIINVVRYARNIFISEKKSILPFSTVLEKLQNSYTGGVKHSELHSVLKKISSQMPVIASFEVVRNTLFMRFDRNASLMTINRILKDFNKQ